MMHAPDFEPPQFTVLIPTYGRPDLVESAIESVIAQTYTDWELIVIDDSSPRPVEAPSDPRIRALRNATNSGKAASLNRGIKEARGRIVAFLDDDDNWSPYRLENAASIHSATEADAVVCATQTLTPNRRSTVREPPMLLRDVKPLARIGPMGATSILRTKCPLLDPSFAACEDIDWWLSVWAASDAIVKIASRDFLWRCHSGERHGNGTEPRIAGFQRLLDKHRDYYATYPAARADALRRLGALHYRNGDRRAALNSGLQSLRARPSYAAFELIARTALPVGLSVAGVRHRLGDSSG